VIDVLSYFKESLRVINGAIAFLAFVVGGMVVFGLTLAWVNHITGR
jgi:hypothetical protein